MTRHPIGLPRGLDPAAQLDRLERPTVIGIVGSGRSGSTLLEFLLAGDIPGSRAVGELETLVYRAIRDNELCTCLVPAQQCPKWRPVIERLVIDPGRSDWEAFLSNRRKRIWWGSTSYITAYISALCPQLRRNSLLPAPTGYRAVVEMLTLLARPDNPVVDNSKTPLHFFALVATGAIDLRLVHLVRHPRAVMWSWTRRKPLPESGARCWTMEPKPSWRAARQWLFDAFMAESLHRQNPCLPYIRISYEDLCVNPAGVLARICDELKLPDHGESTDVEPRPGDYHVLGGNPDRFNGFRVVQEDDEWRQGGRPTWPLDVFFRLVAVPVYRRLLASSRPTRPGHTGSLSGPAPDT